MADVKPRFPIRRFDVFADYNRVKNEASGMPQDQAKGRAVWIAKVVAGRRAGTPVPSRGGAAAAEPSRKPDERRGREKEEEEDKFRSVGGEPQTDKTFDKEIVERMGKEFYQEVFHPAIERAFGVGKRYEDIRDSIRTGWK